MDIILVAGDSAKARTLTLRLSHLLLVWLATLIIVVAATGLALQHFSRASLPPSLSMPVDIGNPAVASAALMEPAPQPAADLHTMASHIAQMEAQLLRLDMLGERLAKLAGFPSRELMLGTDSAERVPLPASENASQPTLDALTSQFDELVARLQQARAGWGALDSLFSLDNLRRRLLPTMSPVETMDYSDSYGWRRDPFTMPDAWEYVTFERAEDAPPFLAWQPQTA